MIIYFSAVTLTVGTNNSIWLRYCALRTTLTAHYQGIFYKNTPASNASPQQMLGNSKQSKMIVAEKCIVISKPDLSNTEAIVRLHTFFKWKLISSIFCQIDLLRSKSKRGCKCEGFGTKLLICKLHVCLLLP